MSETDLRVPVILPSANPRMAQAHLPKWVAMGYRVVMFQDKVRFDIAGCEVYAAGSYIGYPAAINEMYQAVKGIAAAPVVVLIGDDMDPDPFKSPAQIREEFLQKFPDTFGVMQPIGDTMDGTDRICGSPWVGRAYANRINQGRGPLWPEYFHFFADEEMFNVTTKLGCLWQRRDLSHYHNHWSRGGSRPAHMAKAQERWDTDKARHDDRKAKGYPGHEPTQWGITPSVISTGNSVEVSAAMTKMQGHPEYDRLLSAARSLSIAVFQMRSDWAEASPEKQAELWKAAHARNAELFEIMGPTP